MNNTNVRINKENAISDTFIFFVNGNKIEDQSLDPEWTLLRYLREKLLLPGTKLGCGEGGCGACTVMVSKFDPKSGVVRHYSVNSCLAPIGTMHGLSVTTTEGIGSTKTRLHPVQERLAKAHGSQCGFCTPGFVMSMYTLLRNTPKPSMEEIEESIVGNLCRCTGYRPILEGFRTFAAEGTPCGRKDCCKLKGSSNSDLPNDPEEGIALEKTGILFDPNLFTPYDPSQEVIFPPYLKLNPDLAYQSLVFKGPHTTFYRPSTLTELLQLKQSYPEAKIVVGNTEVGVEIKFKNQHYPIIIHPANIPELLVMNVEENFVEVGAALPLSDVESTFKKLVKDLPAFKTKVLLSILEMLRWFAGRQIRNVAAFGGNIMTGSPISDLNPVFMASGAKLTFRSLEGEREILFDNTFFTGYRRNIAKPHEILTTVKIPFTSEEEYFCAYKQARRRDDDIAIVNAAMKAVFEPQSLKLKEISLAFGGMAPTSIMATETMKKLSGCNWDSSLFESATISLLDEMKLDPSAPGGMVDFRRALTASFFFKFYTSVRQELCIKYSNLISPLNKDEEELIKPFKNVTTESTQFFQNVPENQEKIDPIGQPIAHLASLKQTTGEAEYADDIPHYENELVAALVMSTRAHAKILSIDESEAMKMKGVEAFFCARDVPGSNITAFGDKNEVVFASTEVHFVGEVIGVIVAQDQLTAQKAAKFVKIEYEDLPNPIFTIEEAIAAKSMWDPFVAETGDTSKGFQESDFVLEGEMYVGGQDHFYLETNAHIAIPHEGDEIEVIGSTQSPGLSQRAIANVLGIPCHYITCRARRLGGGFGGKESRTQCVSTPIAVAAVKTRRPVRIVLDRDEDMALTGGRHPYLGRWKVGFNKEGRIIALYMDLYSNAGYSIDLSGGVLSRAVLSVDNAYKIENMTINGYNCKTNLASNTAFRGFGSPQSCLIMEDIMFRIAEYLKVHPNKVREVNFYKEMGETTHYGQELGECSIRKCWQQILISSSYKEREMQVIEFNRNNRFKKQGIAIIPNKYPIAFGIPFLNQGGALVLVYRDGSVLVTHGGTEMGQGLHTKMTQVASKVLKIPMERIYISETSTDKVPNSSPTAASFSSDLYGMAVLNACEEIVKRLAPYKAKTPESRWEDWIEAAYMEGVPLFATGFYMAPNLEPYCLKTRKGRPYSYYVYGVSVSQVEIDCLTGDHVVLRTDIVMDIGTSMNPAIDIGQIEGAFMQGYGLFTLEQLVYSRSGALLTKGPGAYKIPSVMDIPREFNVSLLRGESNPRAIFSSKAVGEPPLFSGSSVFFAIREAVKSAAGESAVKGGVYRFDSPATVDRIRMGCQDWITRLIKKSSQENSEGWSLNI